LTGNAFEQAQKRPNRIRPFLLTSFNVPAYCEAMYRAVNTALTNTALKAQVAPFLAATLAASIFPSDSKDIITSF
jgi:hypothetical protein